MNVMKGHDKKDSRLYITAFMFQMNVVWGRAWINVAVENVLLPI